jgi:mono/diheme cytochrome c family protein
MSRRHSISVTGRRTLPIAFALLAFAGAAIAQVPAEEPDYDPAAVERGLQVYKDGGCRSCHGWAANGVREGENPEGPSIRQTLLPPEALRVTVQCGRPNSLMPYFDHQAYNLDERCYGISRFNVNAMGIELPRRGRADFSDQQLDDLIAYLMTRVVGLADEPTLEQCQLFFGDGNAVCAAIE